ncbi:hypothetical protein NDU88_003224 [Pleurodeles waltl]|uniref:Uncharacterized protein n=1 Tax=Pleurodeles waltl TaxID=8319 RepID=A0AAV7UFE2_PLEWA|nr:hypothetical protein NDU88_003224 [Pleurodeles waltl]
MRPCPVTTLSLTEPLPRPLTCCRSDAPKQCADFCPPLLPSTTGHEKKHPCFGTKSGIVSGKPLQNGGLKCSAGNHPDSTHVGRVRGSKGFQGTTR